MGLTSSDGMSAATEPKPTQLFELVSSYSMNGTVMFCMNEPAFEIVADQK